METTRNTLGKIHIDVIDWLCTEWCVPNLKDTAFIRVRFLRGEHKSSSVINIFSAHGNVAGRKGGSKINRLEDLMGSFEADIYMLAHGHKKITHSASILEVPHCGELRLKTKKRVGFMTGSYLRSYQQGANCYAEKGLFPPSDLGCMCVVIKPIERDFWIEG